MLRYLVPFGAYLLTLSLPLFTGLSSVHAYGLMVIVVGSLLFYFRKQYKVKPVFGVLPFCVGALIFMAWVLLEGRYPMFGTSEFTTIAPLYIAVKFFGSVFIAATVEELFTRDFLARYLSAKDWARSPIGMFTPFSFIATALFFGFAHNRWLPGLVAGVLLNLLLIRERNLGSTIIAHSFANLLLGVYVIATGSWQLW